MLRILSHQNVTNFAATKMLHILSPPKCYKPSRHQNVANALSPPKCYKCCRHIDKCCRHILGRYKIIVSPKMLRTLSPHRCYKFCRPHIVSNFVAAKMWRTLSPPKCYKVCRPPKCYEFCRHQNVYPSPFLKRVSLLSFRTGLRPSFFRYLIFSFHNHVYSISIHYNSFLISESSLPGPLGGGPGSGNNDSCKFILK